MPQATQANAVVQASAHIVPALTDSRLGSRPMMTLRNRGSERRTAGPASKQATPLIGTANQTELLSCGGHPAELQNQLHQLNRKRVGGLFSSHAPCPFQRTNSACSVPVFWKI